VIKVIETEYKGYLFRSRLEARWPVFFDFVNIEWDYEKEGYEIAGQRYLPDFWLPEVTPRGMKPPGVFVEIKPQIMLSRKDEKKLLALSLYKPVYCFFGLPGPHYGMFHDSGHEYTRGHASDSYMAFVHCSYCNCVKIDYGESNYCYCPECGSPAHSESSKLMIAYKAAKQARFEHINQRDW
jgi:hypothetical protein